MILALLCAEVSGFWKDVYKNSNLWANLLHFRLKESTFVEQKFFLLRACMQAAVLCGGYVKKVKKASRRLF